MRTRKIGRRGRLDGRLALSLFNRDYSVTYIFLLVGLALMVTGGNFIVSQSVNIAERYRISPLVIGLTLVGFGTSAPELVTSLIAVFQGYPAIAIGNVVGSNIANVLLVLGITALIYPIAVAPDTFRREGFVLMGATLFCAVLIVYGQISRLSGLIALLLLGGYLFATFRADRTAQTSLGVSDDVLQDVNAGGVKTFGPIIIPIALFIAGLFATILGANIFVKCAIAVAQNLGVSETIIGLTIVAIGTSLPELVTSTIAAFKRQTSLAFGNIVGSNIFNILGILGITSLARPFAMPADLALFDVGVMVGAALLLIIAAMTRWTISRREGFVFVLLYLGYVAYLVNNAGG